MAKLNDAQKRVIVQALACWDTPSQVAEAVKDEFGIDVPRMQVAQYDPTEAAGKDLAKKWRDLFDATRKRFREEVAEIPIADRPPPDRMEPGKAYCPAEDGDGWIEEEGRGQETLYRTSDGAVYQPGSQQGDEAYNGIGPIPAWLTVLPRPDAWSVWKDGALERDETAWQAQVQAAAAQNRNGGWPRLASAFPSCKTLWTWIWPRKQTRPRCLPDGAIAWKFRE